jgi:hypothetical protein
MTEIAPLNTVGARRPEAQGIIPPLMRAMTHIGFAIGVLASTEHEDISSETREILEEEIQEAQRHFRNNQVAASPFTNQTTIEMLYTFREQLDTFMNYEMDEKSPVLESLKTLANNAAYVGARFEYSLSGNDADEGVAP